MKMASDPELKERLSAAVASFSSLSILVVGDIMLDQFVWGEVCRISPEAPVPVVNVQDETFLLGGAANVANNLRTLGAKACLSGIVGDDSFGEILRSLAQHNHIDTQAMVETSRPTTLKTRIVARGQQVVRVDRERSHKASKATSDALISNMEGILDRCQCIIISDYNKGVVSKEVMAFLSSKAEEGGLPLLVDPKPQNYQLYRGLSVITPNEKEAKQMSGLEVGREEDLVRVAEEIAAGTGAKGVLITRGAKGMALWQADGRMFSIPTMAKEVFDVTGAGDTVISVVALGLAAGLGMCEAAYLANIAAGIVVGKVGTAAVDREELLDAIQQATLRTPKAS